MGGGGGGGDWEKDIERQRKRDRSTDTQAMYSMLIISQFLHFRTSCVFESFCASCILRTYNLYCHWPLTGVGHFTVTALVTVQVIEGSHKCWPLYCHSPGHCVGERGFPNCGSLLNCHSPVTVQVIYGSHFIVTALVTVQVIYGSHFIVTALSLCR